MIKNVIIYDSSREYSNEEIDKDERLIKVRIQAMNEGPYLKLVTKINSEKGIAYITIDKDYNILRHELKEVTQGLYNEFRSTN